MVEFSDRHRRFFIIEQGAVPTIFNFLLNGVIAWALFRSVANVPLWGEASVGVDLLVTAFVLPFLTCVIVSKIVAGHVRDGKVPPLPSNQLPHSRWFQTSPAKRGVFLGAAGVLFSAVPIVWALSLGQAQPIPMTSFVAFKAVWAAMLALLVTPVVAWWALANASHEEAA